MLSQVNKSILRKSNHQKHRFYVFIQLLTELVAFSTDSLVYVMKHVEFIKIKKDNVIVRQGEKGNW